MARWLVAVLLGVAALVLGAVGAGANSFSLDTLSPADGATVSGTISWQVSPSQPPSTVDFFVDGALIRTDTAPPWSVDLDTRGYPKGPHVLQAVAVRVNDVTASSQVAVTVDNAAPPPPTPAPKLHFATGTKQNQSLALSLGFDVMDVSGSHTDPSETKSTVDALPAGVRALIWVGNLDNSNCTTPGYSDAQYQALVDALGNDPKVYGWYISDEPHPLTCTNAVSDIRGRADYLHAHSSFQKAFIVVVDGSHRCGIDLGCEYRALQPANTDVDLVGLDPYPCHYGSSGNPVPCNYGLISTRVSLALANGTPLAAIVPLIQTFGQEGRTSGSVYYRTPSPDELSTILSTWAAAVPAPPFEYAYSFGTQCSSTSCPAPQALDNHPELQPIMRAHNS
jgi:hypothetical protein